MGGHKWVPQNRGLNVCTSGFGCTSCAVYYEEPSTSPADGEASPMSLVSWLPSFFATLLALARCTMFALFVLMAFLPSAKAMDVPPFGVPPSPSGGGGANTALAAGAAAVAALGFAQLHGATARLGKKGFQRKVLTAVPSPLAPSSPGEPAALPPPH
jgi:hypothetical protein